MLGCIGTYFNNCDFSSNGASSGYTGDGWFRGVSMSQSSPNIRTGFSATMFNNNREDGIIVPALNDNITFVACQAWNNNGVGAPGGHGFEINSDDFSIMGCVSSGNNNGISLNGGNGVVQANVCKNNAGSFGTGIKAYNIDSVQLINNICHDNAAAGIDVNADTGQTCDDITLAFNETYANNIGMYLSNEVISPTLAYNRNHNNTTADLQNNAITPIIPTTGAPDWSAITLSLIHI